MTAPAPKFELPVDTIIEGDCLEVMRDWPDNCVDAVVTDPPYAKKFLPLWEPLGQQAARILKPGGLLISLTGHHAIARVLNDLGKNLDFYWLGAMLGSTGCVARMVSRQMMVSFKPVVWFSKGRVPEHPYVFDCFKAKRDKQYHKWGQDADWFGYYIDKLVVAGGIVLDPFVGGGAVPIACIRWNRHFIGIEKEPEYVEIARRRVLEAQNTLFAGAKE